MGEGNGLGCYGISRKLGEGSFGEVFQAIWHGEDVAIKIERRSTRSPQLSHEYELLSKLQSGVGIPQVFALESTSGYLVMVMELLGSTLHDVFIACNRQFDSAFVLKLGVQMVSRLEFIHSRGVIHRDMKPDNFLLGTGLHVNDVFLIDFGIGRFFRDARSLKHNAMTTGHSLRGTAKYCSINTHLGLDQSRRDDLESLGYVLTYLAKGSLPWENFRSLSKLERHQGIGTLKQTTPLNSLCQSLPYELETFLDYTRSLKYEARPDYKYIKRLFIEAGQRLEANWDLMTLKLPEMWTAKRAKNTVDEPTEGGLELN